MVPFEGSIIYVVDEDGLLYFNCHKCNEKQYFEEQHILVEWVRKCGYKCTVCMTTGGVLKKVVDKYIEDNTMVVVETVGTPEAGKSGTSKLLEGAKRVEEKDSD
jgi:hypothetical protein